MPFVLSRTALVVVVLCISASGGWILSAQSSENNAMQLISINDPNYPTLGTNTLVEGLPLPNLSLPSATGEPVALSSFIGQPMIINFWYSTCEPCRRELPAFAAAHREFSNVIFLGINMNDSVEIAELFSKKYGVMYPTLFDSNGALVSKLGIATAPTTLFVQSNGNIVDQVAGEITSEKLRLLIKQWFST